MAKIFVHQTLTAVAEVEVDVDLMRQLRDPANPCHQGAIDEVMKRAGRLQIPNSIVCVTAIDAKDEHVFSIDA